MFIFYNQNSSTLCEKLQTFFLSLEFNGFISNQASTQPSIFKVSIFSMKGLETQYGDSTVVSQRTKKQRKIFV